MKHKEKSKEKHEPKHEKHHEMPKMAHKEKMGSMHKGK